MAKAAIDRSRMLTAAYAERTSIEYAYSWWQFVGTGMGALGALALHWQSGTHGAFPLMAATGAVATGFGVTLGLHRLFSHRSFQARRPLEVALFILGTAAGQGYPIRWILDHRIHHRHTDVPGDPHSPLWYGSRRLGLVSGFLHAHVLWLFRPRQPLDGQVVRDLAADSTLVWLDRAAPLIVATGLLIPGLIGLLVDTSAMGFVNGVLWGGLVRMFLLNHVTWSVNSVCHMFGETPSGSSSRARNNPVVGVLALGEGWHGNHHLAPGSARHGWRWYQVDLSWMLLRLLQIIGLVVSVRVLPGAASTTPTSAGGG